MVKYSFNLLSHQNGECMIDQICDECWKTLFQFNEFCERVREMHESFIENDKDAVAIEYVEEEIDERYLDQSELDTDILPTLTIEKDLENNASLARRQCELLYWPPLWHHLKIH